MWNDIHKIVIFCSRQSLFNNIFLEKISPIEDEFFRLKGRIFQSFETEELKIYTKLYQDAVHWPPKKDTFSFWLTHFNVFSTLKWESGRCHMSKCVSVCFSLSSDSSATTAPTISRWWKNKNWRILTLTPNDHYRFLFW